MELYAVKGMLSDELEIVVTVDGRLVEELDDEVTLRRLYEDLEALLALTIERRLRAQKSASKGRKSCRIECVICVIREGVACCRWTHQLW